MVYADQVLEHMSGIDAARQFVAEAHRVLRPGGVLFVVVPDYLAERGFFWDIDYTHNFVTTERRVKQLFYDGGFETRAMVRSIGAATGFTRDLLAAGSLLALPTAGRLINGLGAAGVVRLGAWAAAAGLVVGVGTGRGFDIEWQPAGAAPVQARSLTATAPAPTPADETDADDAILGEVEWALAERGVDELQPLDALTPRVTLVASR